MMEIINLILKELSHIYKAGMALIIILLWPLAIAFTYFVDINFFTKTDIVKLTLLSAAFTMPLVLVNSILLYFVLMPINNKELREKKKVEKPLAAAFLFSVIITAFIFVIANVIPLFLNASDNVLIGIVVCSEVIIIAVLGLTIWKEKV